MNILQKHQANLQRLRSKIKSICAGAMFMGALLCTENVRAQNFVFDTFQVNPFGLVNIPSDNLSTVSLADLDNDGDLDLISGEAGYMNVNFYYYENIGSSSSPNFAAPQTNPFGLTSIDRFNAPRFVDLDNDGDLDIMAAERFGNFKYFKNTGTANAPDFDVVQINPFGLYSCGNVVDFVDLDNDGDLDLFMGDSPYGDFFYYANTGTASNPNFNSRRDNPFALNPLNLGSYSYTAPTFVDWDNDGDMDFLSGAYSANFHYYENIGTNSNPGFNPPILNPSGIDSLPGIWNSFSFADLDNDGDKDLLSGLDKGNFYYFQNQSINTSINKAAENSTIIFPNPAQDIITVQTAQAWQNATIRLVNLNGQVISQQQNVNGNQISLDLKNLPKAIYFIEIEMNNSVSHHKISKQ